MTTDCGGGNATDAPPAAFDAVDDDSVVEFVAELWRRAGWTVEPAADRDDVAFATRTSNGRTRRTVLRAFPSSEGRVTGAAMRGVVDSLQPANRVTAVSLVGFEPDALDVADAYGVDVVGPDSVHRLLVASDAEDLVDGAS